MTAETHNLTPKILPIGEVPSRRLGFGSMQLTGPGHWAEPASPEQAMQVLRDAVDAGITHIDTADSYGPFTAETYIRKALHPYADGLVIATKGGLTRQGPDRWAPCGQPQYLRQCVEMSLRRLQVERIDLYYLHRIDPVVPMEDQLAVLADMQSEGKIRNIGMSKVDISRLRKAGELVDVAAVQNEYNVATRASEDVLRYCELNNIAFASYAPLAAGQLTEPGGALDELSSKYGATPAQLALAWLLQRSPVMMPIPGTSNSAHLHENLAATQIELTREDIVAIGLAVDSNTVATVS
jgi:pyridoxine 4-dehydrogenase